MMERNPEYDITTECPECHRRAVYRDNYGKRYCTGNGCGWIEPPENVAKRITYSSGLPPVRTSGYVHVVCPDCTEKAAEIIALKAQIEGVREWVAKEQSADECQEIDSYVVDAKEVLGGYCHHIKDFCTDSDADVVECARVRAELRVLRSRMSKLRKIINKKPTP